MDLDRPMTYSIDEFEINLEKGESSIFYDWRNNNTSVTYFHKNNGVKLVASDDPSYDDGKERAIFGVVLLGLIMSGETVITEL